MQLKLEAEKGPCGIELRQACMIIAYFFLTITVLGVIVHPSYLGTSQTLVGFILLLVANFSLLFGALKGNRWLVLVWLINAALFFIGWPIAVLGVILNFGGYRQISPFNNVFLILLDYVITLCFQLFCTRLVYSYFQQLRKSQSNPQHAVVV